jgi:hypothetical protein
MPKHSASGMEYLKGTRSGGRPDTARLSSAQHRSDASNTSCAGPQDGGVRAYVLAGAAMLLVTLPAVPGHEHPCDSRRDDGVKRINPHLAHIFAAIAAFLPLSACPDT